MNGSIEVSTLVGYLGLAIGGGAVLVPLLAQAFKKVFGLESGVVIHTMVLALGVILAGAQYVMQVHGQLPIALPGVSALTMYGVSQLVYKYAGYSKDILGRVQISLAPAAAPAVAAIAADPAAPAEPVAPAEPNPADIAPASTEFNA